MLRAADRVRRVGLEDVARDEPIEEPADGGEVLLYRRCRGNRRLKPTWIPARAAELWTG